MREKERETKRKVEKKGNVGVDSKQQSPPALLNGFLTSSLSPLSLSPLSFILFKTSHVRGLGSRDGNRTSRVNSGSG